MLRILCPWCGLRDETEFRYRGDATVRRPPADAGVEAFSAYVYARENPCGWHKEWWLHVAGCRRLLRLERHTLTDEIRSIEPASELQGAERLR